MGHQETAYTFAQILDISWPPEAKTSLWNHHAECTAPPLKAARFPRQRSRLPLVQSSGETHRMTIEYYRVHSSTTVSRCFEMLRVSVIPSYILAWLAPRTACAVRISSSVKFTKSGDCVVVTWTVLTELSHAVASSTVNRQSPEISTYAALL